IIVSPSEVVRVKCQLVSGRVVASPDKLLRNEEAVRLGVSLQRDEHTRQGSSEKLLIEVVVCSLESFVLFLGNSRNHICIDRYKYDFCQMSLKREGAEKFTTLSKLSWSFEGLDLPTSRTGYRFYDVWNNS